MPPLDKNSPDDATAVALRLAARAEQTSSGILNKLLLRGFSKTAAASVVSVLQAENIINDERYAEMWLASRLRRSKAETPRVLLEKLLSKNLSRTIAAQALKTALNGDAEMELLKKYHQQNPGLPREGLRHEGFSAETLENFFDEYYA